MSRDLGPNARLIGVPGSRAQLDTPALLIDLDRLERNVARMAEHARRTGRALRPHAKTHKSVEIARRQVAAGALGQCCATLGEAEVLVDGGIAGVLITAQLVTEPKIQRLVALHARAEGLMAVADHPDGVAAFAAAFEGSAARPLGVVVDVDCGRHRTGVASEADAVELARRIAAAPGLRFAGIQAYAGHLQHVADFGERRAKALAVREQLRSLRAALAAEGLRPGIVTGVGTGTYAPDSEDDTFTELQTGSYVFMDVDYWNAMARDPGPVPFETALFVQVAVISTNAEGWVTTDGGFKVFATDGPKPEIAAGAPAGSRYIYMGDEHGGVLPPEGAAAAERPALGARIECVTPHCDPTVNLHDVYHVVRGDTLVDIWPVDARGRH
ncbi:MAG TPA: DSD1 family PLP-dependent enzyme [Geminicoccaceae bacterium]|nr:DSD1 family PLP-dependent enzyme [Geminicoccaceae bacterium]